MAINNAFASANRVALVVGNANYSIVNKLKNSLNDATDITAALKRLRFSVQTVLDGSKSQMLEAIDNFKNNAQGADIALFFYAGHGIQYQERNYLIPIELSLSDSEGLQSNAVDAELVIQAMRNAGSKANVIILDACRNNPLISRGLRRDNSSSNTRSNDSNEGLAPMETISGTLISFATQPGNVALDGDSQGRNGLYTGQLIRYIEKSGIDIVQMFNQVSLAVQQENSRQQPWIHFSAVPPICLAKCSAVANPALDSATKRVKNLEPETQAIKSGSFLMGDAQKVGDADERPPHREHVDRFSASKFEVTVGQFRKFVEATDYLTDSEQHKGCWEWTGQLPWRKNSQLSWKNPNFSQRDDSPVVCVSWQDAQQYAQWLSDTTGSRYRLPTETEWEYMARAGSTTPYLSGFKIGNGVAHCAACPGSQYGSGTAPVGSFKANRFGLYDLQGNVWEWVANSYSTYDGRDNKPMRRVARGGSWTDIQDTLRLSGRIHFPIQHAMVNLGFRVIRD